MAVGEAGEHDRREPRTGLDPSTQVCSARQSGVSIGERVPPTCSARIHSSSHSPGTPARSSASISRRRPGPGSSRQSTSITHEPGITFRLRDASIIVGERVAARSGATSCAASGWSARARSRATSRGGASPSHGLEERLHLGEHRAGRLEPRERLEHRGRLEERVVGRVRIRRVAAPAPEPKAERRGRLLRDRAEVVRAAAEDAALAASLVDGEVGAHRLRVLAREPRHAEVEPDLLVRREGEQHVARGTHALADERGERDGRRRDMALHVERAASPDLAVDEVARPRIARPLVGIREHRVRVRHQQDARPVRRRAGARRGSPARASSRRARSRRRSRARYRCSSVGGAGLVPRRVDGVETQERPEELRHLVPERHTDSAFDRAVSSLRTSHSSGKTTVCTSLPSTSTGVPCVPTTPSPITRATTR